MSQLVAVYGSLKRGYGNHGFLDTAELLNVTRTAESDYKMFALGGYPGVVKSDEGYKIHVEVYEVDDETFKSLDGLEGHPSFYCRELTDLEDGQQAWMYIYQGNCTERQEVVDGNW